MDVSSLALLLDRQEKYEVDHRLYFTQRENKMAETTRTVVYATDPLKDLSNPLESMITVPTNPPSNKIHLIGGHFFANGKLYTFPGMESPTINIDTNQDTYVLTGVRIDPKTDKTSFYCETYHGEWPFMDSAVVPSALIKVPRGYTKIVSQFIMDIRPFIHYNVSLPEDRVVIDVACINPGESISFSLMRNHRLPPILNFYKKVPPSGVHTITHNFDSLDDIVVLGKDQPGYLNGAVTLRKKITTDPIDMPDAPNILFVEPLVGKDTNPGTWDRPMLSLEAAIDRYNGMTQYDTIFLRKGIYTPSKTLTINRKCQIVGYDPNNVYIRFIRNMVAIEANDEITFRTVQFYKSNQKQASSADADIVANSNIFIYNCILKQVTDSEVLRWIKYESNLTISNCVFHNPYYVKPAISQSELYSPSATNTTGILTVQNCYLIGPWKTSVTLGNTTRNHADTGDGSSIGWKDFTEYRPAEGAVGTDDGLALLVGADLDGSATDVGIYGGKYASKAEISEYPIDEMPIFKYAYSTLFAPVIDRFVTVEPIIGFSPSVANCKVYGAVSFNGGHDWLVWDKALGAFKRIADLETLDTNGTEASELAQRLVDMGPIQTRGEICFAWALKTSMATYTPSIQGVKMTVKASADTITPITPDNLGVWIADDTVMITNKASDSIRDVVVVGY